MNERNALSLPTIIASQDARRGGFLGLSAVSLHRLSLVIPALCALAYPSLLSWLSAGLVLVHGSDSPNGPIVWVGVIGSLTLALAVMLVSFCIRTDARIAACRETRGLSRPMRCPSGVCHTLSLRGVRKRRRRVACAFSSAGRMAHLLDADGDDRPAELRVGAGGGRHRQHLPYRPSDIADWPLPMAFPLSRSCCCSLGLTSGIIWPASGADQYTRRS